MQAGAGGVLGHLSRICLRTLAEYKDLSPYEYLPLRVPVAGEILNVGWLGKVIPFSTGSLPVDFWEELVKVVPHFKTNVTRGFYQCRFCGARQVRVEAPVPLILGHMEFHIPGADGIVYAAPSMVVHYISDHKYRPPDGFVEAVQAAARADK